jgi:hypothetical protein
MKNILNKYLHLNIILIIGCACLLLPFIVLGIFNHPSADDYAYANASMNTGFWRAQIGYYTGWQGRYFTTPLLLLDPLIFKSILIYRLIPLILILALFHALYKFIQELTNQNFGKRKIFMATLVLLTLYVWRMPSVAQGFYWFTGAIVYQIPNILTLYLCVCMIRLFKVQQKTLAALYGILSVFLIFAIAGSNEVSMVLLLLLFLLAFVIDAYLSRKINWALMGFVIIAGVASYFVVFAPGNNVRLALYPHQQNIIASIKLSALSVVKSMFNWTVSLPILASTIIFMQYATTIISSKIKYKKKLLINPIISFFMFVMLLGASFFPTYWGTGEAPPIRTINVIYLFFLIGWFVNVYIFVDYFASKYGIIQTQLPKYVIILMFIFSFLTLVKDDNNNIRTAYADLITGKALQYDRELTNRYKIIRESQENKCEVNKLNELPETIYFDDITDNSEDWRNKEYATYFHKGVIILRK